MKPWVERPTLVMDHDLSATERVRAVPDEAVEAARPLLYAILREFPAPARAIADLVRLRTGGRFHSEALAMGRRIGESWRPIILANVCYDLALAALGCSTAAIASAGGPILARNMDWWPQDLLARATYRVEHLVGGKVRYVSAGFVGSIGIVTACAPGRFALALNAAISDRGSDKLGYPVLLHLRRVMDDAEDFDSAVKMIEEARLAAPGIFTVVGMRNEERVVIEKAPGRTEVMRAEGDGPLVATNHFRRIESNLVATARKGVEEIAMSCSGRLGRLAELCAGMDGAGEPAVEELLYYLSDPGVIQEITAQHTVAQPGRGMMRVFVPAHLLGDGGDTR